MHITRMEDADGVRECWFSSHAFSGIPNHDTWLRCPQGSNVFAHGYGSLSTPGSVAAPLAVYPVLSGAYIKLFVFRANTEVDGALNATVMPCTLEVRYHNALTSAYVGTDGVLSLEPIALNYFALANASVARLLGMPNVDFQMNRSSVESVMFHDDTAVYSLVAHHPAPKTFDIIDLENRSVSSGFVPVAAQDDGVTMEIAYFGNGGYLAVCRQATGIRRTLSISTGSPFTGWDDVAPLGEYIHVEPVWYDPVTEGLYLEAVLYVDSQYRFATYHRRGVEIATWRLLGRVQNMPTTGTASFAMTSYGRQAFGLKKRRTPASRSTYYPTSNDTSFTAVAAKATGPLSYEAA